MPITDFVISDGKNHYAEWFASVDLTEWLGTEVISSVDFAASGVGGTDASSAVLNSAKNTNTNTLIKPWIKGGVSGKTYVVYLRVTTDTGSKEQFTITFKVR